VCVLSMMTCFRIQLSALQEPSGTDPQAAENEKSEAGCWAVLI